MRIAVAQTRPVRGNLPVNIANHKKLIGSASAFGASAIFFPELSLTGYEPALAGGLATDINDDRLDALQQASDLMKMIIGAGMPLKNERGISIGMIIFKPGKDRTTNYKNYLHPDEYPFFVRGESTPVLQAGALKIGLAICYEISVTEHTDQVIRHRPGIFVASVAKSGKGIGRALDLLAGIAKTHSIPVLMANAVGTCDGEEMAGLSSIWDGQGLLKGRLDKESEGILVFDSLTSEMISQVI